MPTRPLLIAAASAALLAPFSPSIAQSEPPAPAFPPSKGVRPTPQPPAQDDSRGPGPIVTVEFPGGTAKQYVDAVRQAASQGGPDGTRINVIIPKEAEAVPLPAISLRDVNVYIALQAVEYAADPNGTGQFSVALLGKGNESSITYAIKYGSRHGTPQPAASSPPPRPETRVMSVSDLIEPPPGLEKDPTMVASTDTILNALKAASQLDVNANVQPPEIMFHKDSQLLIIRGTSDQLRTMESVIGQLIHGLNSRRADAAAAADREKNTRLQKAEMDAQLAFNESQQRLTLAEVDRATANLTRVTELVKAGHASTAEAGSAQAQLDQARAIHEQARAAERSLKERQTILEVRAQAGGAGSGAGPVEVPVTLIYEVADLEPFAGDIWAIMRAVVKLRTNELEMKHNVQGRGTLSLLATPAEHSVIVKALNGMRRAKANEPKLPGLDADDLIRKAREK